MTNLHKLFSPEHLLKNQLANDNNSLNITFYNELLHVIGLQETKEDKKQIITRLKPNERNPASLLENAINILDTEDRLKHIKDLEKRYGEKKDEQLFNVALELSIMWINRILFLKLLEAQLLQYHRDNAEYLFLNTKNISNFNQLNELFFEVLAKKSDERNKHIKEKYTKIPYLNSSLFEISKLEDETIRINSLKEHFKLPVNDKNILKEEQELPILEYIFSFLNAYDFTNEGHGKIQEENKNLINASVLGLIFEKINGYKEGSYFTPGYITMYMTRENIRKAVVQKFKEAGYPNPRGFQNLAGWITDRKQANEIINSLKICDPSVGSGHFLVSALNEIIAIKSELDILQYYNENRIKNYKIEVVNDELIVTDKETDELFEYNLSEKGNTIDYKQDLQKALFHEKQTIIENCLFGVDINPNSVNITRLRLWIELLKNSYYRRDVPCGTSPQLDAPHGASLRLETLPNIDINIKQGNSLVGRFALNGNGITNGQAQKMRLATEKYKTQVILYKSTNDKTVKQNAEKEILRIKEQFAQNVNPTDNEKLHTLYGKAFEWRFEFPEVLDENGNFMGFDIVIGNPPYIGVRTSQIDKQQSLYFKGKYKLASGQYDLFSLFIELSYNILRRTGFHSFIIPKRFVTNQNFKKVRNFCVNDFNLYQFVDSAMPFNNTNVESCIIFNQKENNNKKIKINSFQKNNISETGEIEKSIINLMPFNILPVYISLESVELIQKINLKNKLTKLGEIVNIIRGFEFGYNHESISKNKTKYKIIRGSNILKYAVKFDDFYVNANFENTDIFKKEEFFLDTPKLLTRFVSNQLVFSYDDIGYCNTNVVYNIHLKNNNYKLKYLLALLNSKLLDFYFFNIYSNNDKVFPHIQKNQLETIPIKDISTKEQQIFIDKVNKIIELKQNNINADTYKLENEIDELVYKLYNLSEKEIEIIKNETS